MTIITRSALIAWGRKDIQPDLASIVDGRVVTWSEVMDNRRKRQTEILQHKRFGYLHPMRAWKLWVAYYDMPMMGGWQCMIEHFRYDWGLGRVWIDRDRRQLKPILMSLFPLVLPLGGERDQWEAWKAEFAKAFRRRKQDRKPLGVAYVWWDGRDQIQAVRS